MPLLITQPSPQGLGSALTYARRYSLCAVLNLVADADDDGQAAKPSSYGKPPKTKRQAPKPAGRGFRTRRHATPNARRSTSCSRRSPRRRATSSLRSSRRGGSSSSEGWMDKLTPSRDGTASLLIELLQERKAKQRERTYPRTSDDLGQARHRDSFGTPSCAPSGPSSRPLCRRPVPRGRLQVRRLDPRRAPSGGSSRGRKRPRKVAQVSRRRRPVGARRRRLADPRLRRLPANFRAIATTRTAAPRAGARARTAARAHARRRAPPKM